MAIGPLRSIISMRKLFSFQVLGSLSGSHVGCCSCSCDVHFTGVLKALADHPSSTPFLIVFIFPLVPLTFSYSPLPSTPITGATLNTTLFPTTWKSHLHILCSLFPNFTVREAFPHWGREGWAEM